MARLSGYLTGQLANPAYGGMLSQSVAGGMQGIADSLAANRMSGTDVNDISVWENEARRRLASGDTAGAAQIMSYINRKKQMDLQNSALMQSQRDATQDRKLKTQAISADSDRMLAQIQAEQKAKEKEQKQLNDFANMAEKRVGKENADILRMMDKNTAIQAYRGMINAKGTTKIIERVDDDGNTRSILIDENGNDVADLGIKKLAISPKDQATMSDKAAKEDLRTQQHIKTAQGVRSNITKAKELVQNGTLTTGLGGQAMRNVGGTDARDLQGKLTSIKANLGFDRLQAMREASPTGGALGQVAIQELVALQSTVDSLDQAQSAEALLEALEQVDRHYANWLGTLEGKVPEGSVIDFNDLP